MLYWDNQLCTTERKAVTHLIRSMLVTDDDIETAAGQTVYKECQMDTTTGFLTPEIH